MPQELCSVLPEQAWELGPGSGRGWWRSLPGQPPSRLVAVNPSGPAWMLGQGSSFARQVSQPHPGSAGPDWDSKFPTNDQSPPTSVDAAARRASAGELAQIAMPV